MNATIAKHHWLKGDSLRGDGDGQSKMVEMKEMAVKEMAMKEMDFYVFLCLLEPMKRYEKPNGVSEFWCLPFDESVTE